MIAPQSLRLGPLVLDLSHITTHRNKNKLIPIDLKKMIYWFYFLITLFGSHIAKIILY